MFLKIKVFFQSVNICSLKALKFGFEFFFLFKKKVLCFALYNLCTFLGLGDISLEL